MCTVRQAIYIVRAYSIQRIYRNELSTKGGHTIFFLTANRKSTSFQAHYIIANRKFLRCVSPQIENPQIFRLITLSQNRLGERLQTRTCQANRTAITILLVAWQKICRTHACIRRQVQRWHIRQTRQTCTLPSVGIHAVHCEKTFCFLRMSS